jgi:hypothetical protein
MGPFTASVADLRAFTDFLEGLAELPNRTGVIACTCSEWRAAECPLLAELLDPED